MTEAETLEFAERFVNAIQTGDVPAVRACYAPGCVLYFMKTHPRREWCSVACGNRVRAAEILGISPRTVNKHLEQIFTKLGVENRASAAAQATKILAARN